jgi:HAD superfamily hydrolase (TIGR01509 family)
MYNGILWRADSCHHKYQEPRTKDRLMTANAPVHAVVFDLDGLMFNTEELYQDVGAELLRRRGQQFTGPLLDAMMGRPSPVALQIMIDWHQLDTTVAQLEAETDALFPAILDARLTPMPGLLELLAALEQAGIPKAVATSRRSFVIDVLSRFDLEPQFMFLLTAEDVMRGKPDPEIYRTACRRLGCQPPHVMVLEDSENGCRAAVVAGTFAVAVPGFHSRNHSFTGTRFIASSLADPRIYQAIGLVAGRR